MAKNRKDKRPPLEIKKKIIILLKEKERSLRELDIKVNCGYRTIIKQCEELKFLNIINIIKHNKNPKTGRPYTSIKLTLLGKQIKI